MTRDPAGDVDYEAQGHDYSAVRRPDPRIAAEVLTALGDARSVLNVGAGAGSYEPDDRYVAAVEPSASMRAQRPSTAAPAVDATAEKLPFDDDSFDAAMATVTIHQWRDLEKGLRELRRVSRGQIVILTFDGQVGDRFWLNEYIPDLIAVEQRRYPLLDHVAAVLGGHTEVHEVAIPSTAPTASPKRSTAARSGSSTPPSAPPSPPGGSSTPTPPLARSTTSHATCVRAPGIATTDTSAPNPATPARCACSPPDPEPGRR